MARINLDDLRTDTYDRNRDRGRDGSEGHCLICGKAMNRRKGAYAVHMTVWGELVTEGEPLQDGEDQGGFLIGSECYRRHRSVLSDGFAHKITDD